MQTISKRIIEIKKQLDELEGHVNSTLSILDCQKYVLDKYPQDYKNFKWREYNRYASYNWTPLYKTEEETMQAIDKYLVVFEDIHAKNVSLIEKNTETFNKIRDFLVKMGFSTTTYAHSGTGKNRRSYQADSDWVAHLKTEYPMIDQEYNDFTNWYLKEVSEIKVLFSDIRTKELRRQQEQNAKRIEEEEETKKEEEQTKAINMATEYLVKNGKVAGRDFTSDNAIDFAFKLKMELFEMSMAKEELNISRPRIINATDRMEI